MILLSRTDYGDKTSTDRTRVSTDRDPVSTDRDHLGNPSHALPGLADNVSDMLVTCSKKGRNKRPFPVPTKMTINLVTIN